MTVAQDSLLQLVPSCISESMKVDLARTLTTQELKDSCFKLVKSKSLNLDGQAVELFRECWDFIGEEFRLMVQQSIGQVTLPDGMTSDTIVLLPKGGNKQHLTNWRPITLLNTLYKIVAKALKL